MLTSGKTTSDYNTKSSSCSISDPTRQCIIVIISSSSSLSSSYHHHYLSIIIKTMTVAITVIQFQSLAFLASSSSPVLFSAVSSMITLDIKFPSFLPVWCNSPGQRVHSLTHWYGPAHPPTLGAASHQFNNQLRNNILHSMRQSVKQLFLHLWHFVALIRPIVPFQQFRFNPASHSPGPAPLWRSVSFHSSNTAHHSPTSDWIPR